MREIKFRAWDTKKKKMITNHDTIVLPRYISCGADGRGDMCFEVHNFKIMQFTGLKDKNEKDIYEGDILNFDNNIIQITLGEDVVTLGYKVIKYEEENCLPDIRLYRTEESSEILGNIYENPELNDAVYTTDETEAKK